MAALGLPLFGKTKAKERKLIIETGK